MDQDSWASVFNSSCDTSRHWCFFMIMIWYILKIDKKLTAKNFAFWARCKVAASILRWNSQVFPAVLFSIVDFFDSSLHGSTNCLVNRVISTDHSVESWCKFVYHQHSHQSDTLASSNWNFSNTNHSTTIIVWMFSKTNHFMTVIIGMFWKTNHSATAANFSSTPDTSAPSVLTVCVSIQEWWKFFYLKTPYNIGDT